MQEQRLLYKYRPCNEYTIAIFLNGCLHYSHPSDFNDPYDCLLCHEGDEQYRYLLPSADKSAYLSIDVDIKELLPMLQHEVNDTPICCFSRNGRQMQMWSHYADYHRGLCLEFDEELLLDRRYCDVHPVIYKPEQIRFDVTNTKCITPKTIQFLYTKHSSWAYEEEVRFFHKPEPGSNDNYPFNKKALKSIYFGSRCSQDNIKLYKELCRMNGFEHVKFYQMKLGNKGKFELEPEELIETIR